MLFSSNNILALLWTYKHVAGRTPFFASARDTQTSCNAHLKENTNNANFVSVKRDPSKTYKRPHPSNDYSFVWNNFDENSNTLAHTFNYKWFLKSVQFAIIYDLESRPC